MTIDFEIGDEVWYGAYPEGARHHGQITKILVDENGVRYMITGSKENHKCVYKTEKDTVIASLKQDIQSHLDYVEWLKKQLKIWEEKQ